MSLYNFIDIHFINPLRALPVQWRYSVKRKYKQLNNTSHDHHIVVSLTSFPPRFDTLHYTLKSIFNQTMMPDVILLVLSKDEIKDESELPESVLELKKYGLEIFFADDNLKPHNKYFYASKLYPHSILITVDDDCMYDKNLVQSLYNSFLRYPSAVSARRVHKITLNNNGDVLPYDKWRYEYRKEVKPSYDLLATGVGGVLYPPGILAPETFDDRKIKELCLNADDIWLKFMEIKNNVPVVWVKNKTIHPLIVTKAQKKALSADNYGKNQNDVYIDRLQKYYGINPALRLKDNFKKVLDSPV